MNTTLFDGIYHKYRGKSGHIWLVADQGNCCDPVIYLSDPQDRGFSGRWLTFPLEEGGEIRLQGPAVSNPDSLYEDTGVDLRKKH